MAEEAGNEVQPRGAPPLAAQPAIGAANDSGQPSHSIRSAGRARWALALAMAGLSVLTVLGRSAIAGAPLVTVAGVLAVAAITFRIGWFPDRSALQSVLGRYEPWWLLVAGIAVLLSTTTGSALPSGGHPVSAWPAFGSLLAYPLLCAGLLRLIRARVPGRDVDLLVDAGLAATACGLVLWVLAVHRDRTISHLGVAAVVVSIIVPALDVGLLTLACRLFLLPGERIGTCRFLVLAVAYLLGAHVASTLASLGDWQAPDAAFRVLWICCFGLWGLAALDPSMHELFEPLKVDPPLFSPGHALLVCGAMLVAPAIAALDADLHVVVSSTVAIGAAVSSPVLSAYVANLLWDRARIQHRAQRDDLTGLPNRTLFLDRLARAVAHGRRSDGIVAVLFVDLDQFKEVNDTFGHRAGDHVLLTVAERMRSTLRDEDTVARLSGDEFGVLLPHMSDLHGVVTVAEKLLAVFREPIGLADKSLVVTPSVGVAMFPQDGDSPEELVASADAAMYRAKGQGRNTYEIFSPALRTQAQDRLVLEAGLRRAMEREELVLHYQPVIDLQSMRIVGAEALVRWEHPDHGLLFPGDFIPVAEQSGLVVAMGQLVLHAACEQNKEWQRQGLPPMKVAVNVSARQFRQGIVDTAASALRNTGLDPRWLELELTESAAIENFDTTIAALADLRGIGVGCALDDFGTGYCGLKYLSQLPISTLKIDKSFVQAMSVRDASIVTAIINLGHGLGLRVIAEGVETTKQLDCLVGQGCDDVQGFLFSKPVPPSDFARLIAAQATRLDGANHAADPGLASGPAARGPSEGFERWSPVDVGLVRAPGPVSG
jgi:diguanylate cyclase (GGDEF)-like protein